MEQRSLITADKSKSPLIMGELKFFRALFWSLCAEGVFKNPGSIIICFVISKCDFSHAVNDLWLSMIAWEVCMHCLVQFGEMKKDGMI